MAQIVEVEEPQGEFAEIDIKLTDSTEAEPKIETTEAESLPEKYKGKSAEDLVKMHQEAERLIGRQAQEVGEVRKLADELIKSQLTKKAEPEQISNLTEEFENRGYISDEAFTLWLVDMRKRGGKSNRAIENELFKKGVAREIVSKSMPKDEAEEEDRLRAVYAKKSQLSRYKADPSKLIQYLLRQGFSYGDVKKIMSKG